MSRPLGLRPVAELASARPHGHRLRYMAGCRCTVCRRGNADYENQRRRAREAGEWNGYVSAKRVRRHLLELRRRGVGRRAIADASNVSPSIVRDLQIGAQTQLRAMTEKRLLAVNVGARLDHARVPADGPRRLIAELVEEGFTKAYLSRRLGYRTPALQIGDGQSVTVKNAARIERLHRLLTT